MQEFSPGLALRCAPLFTNIGVVSISGDSTSTGGSDSIASKGNFLRELKRRRFLQQNRAKEQVSEREMKEKELQENEDGNIGVRTQAQVKEDKKTK